MLSFFAITVVSCLLSARPLNYHLSTVFSLIGLPMFTFWLCRRIPFASSNVARLVLVLIAIGGYLGLCGLCEHYDWRLFIFPDYIFNPSIGIHFGRSRGPFVQAQIFGGVLCFIALLTLWYLNHVRATVITVMLLALMFASIYLTDTRAVWVYFALSVVILAVTRNGMRRYACGAVLLVLAIFLSGALSKFSLYEVTLFKRRDEAALSRVVLANASLAFIKSRPLLGAGYGAFAYGGTDRLLDREQERMVQLEGNHHTILGLLVEVGIVGYASVRADPGWLPAAERSVFAVEQESHPCGARFCGLSVGRVGRFLLFDAIRRSAICHFLQLSPICHLWFRFRMDGAFAEHLARSSQYSLRESVQSLKRATPQPPDAEMAGFGRLGAHMRWRFVVELSAVKRLRSRWC